MFDHLLGPSVPIKRVRAREHIAIVALMVTSVVVVSVVNAQMFSSKEVIEPVLHATATITIAQPENSLILVPPLNLVPLATASVRIEATSLTLQRLSFLLDGAYDVSEIQGIHLNIDDAQVGTPMIPQQDGSVIFDLQNLILTPGMHTISLLIDAEQLRQGSVLTVDFDAKKSFVSSDEDAALTVLVPSQPALFVSKQNGTLNAFVSSDSLQLQGRKSRVYISADGEDALLHELKIAEVPDLARIDVFFGNTFIGTGLSLNGFVNIPIDENVLIANGRARAFDIVLSDISESQRAKLSTIILAKVSGLGVQSKTMLVRDLAVQIPL